MTKIIDTILYLLRNQVFYSIKQILSILSGANFNEIISFCPKFCHTFRYYSETLPNGALNLYWTCLKSPSQ